MIAGTFMDRLAQVKWWNFYQFLQTAVTSCKNTALGVVILYYQARRTKGLKLGYGVHQSLLVNNKLDDCSVDDIAEATGKSCWDIIYGEKSLGNILTRLG